MSDIPRIVSSRCLVPLKRPITDESRVRVTVNGIAVRYSTEPPDVNSPHGSIEPLPCPSAGGLVEITYLQCPN